MNTFNTLERRSYDALCTDGGNLLIVAADQRNGMKAVLPDVPVGHEVTIGELVEVKADLVRWLANKAPAVLLDPEVALPAVVDASVLAADTELVVGLDASGFETRDGLRYTRYVPGMTPRRVRDLGGGVAKMLWYSRPDRQGADSELAAEMRDLIDACTAEGLLLIVELLTYQLDGETDEEYSMRFPSLVAEGARLAVACGAKVLKLQYPGSAEGCQDVTAAADGVPWAVLSAGVDHDSFLPQVTVAMANGAAGAMAGRSLWKDCLALDAARRKDLLGGRALGRLRELSAAVDSSV